MFRLNAQRVTAAPRSYLRQARRRCSTDAAAGGAEEPSMYQLLLQARLAAVPMVGFRVDNNATPPQFN